MALYLYTYDESSYTEVSSDTTSPIETVHNGKSGSNVILQLYLKNDDDSKWYSNIRIEPEDTITSDTYDDTKYYETGWGIKLSNQEVQPTKAEWDDIEWGDSIVMSNIGSNSAADIATYYPFWYLVSSPPNCDAQNKTDINLKVYYTENAVS